jgi:hypothetical protein
MFDRSIFTCLPFLYKINDVVGNIHKYDGKVFELVFERPLTDDEQELVNDKLDINLVDWRDDQTLWYWKSEEIMNEWLDSLSLSSIN